MQDVSSSTPNTEEKLPIPHYGGDAWDTYAIWSSTDMPRYYFFWGSIALIILGIICLFALKISDWWIGSGLILEGILFTLVFYPETKYAHRFDSIQMMEKSVKMRNRNQIFEILYDQITAIIFRPISRNDKHSLTTSWRYFIFANNQIYPFPEIKDYEKYIRELITKLQLQHITKYVFELWVRPGGDTLIFQSELEKENRKTIYYLIFLFIAILLYVMDVFFKNQIVAFVGQFFIQSN